MLRQLYFFYKYDQMINKKIIEHFRLNIQPQITIYFSGGSKISPRRGRQLPGGAPTYDFVNICRKLHENEENLAARGRASPAPPLDPPLYLEKSLGSPSYLEN